MALVARNPQRERSLLLLGICAASLCLATADDDACKVCACHRSLLKVNCNGRGLKSLPNGIPQDTVWLNLKDNHLTTLKTSSFQNHTRLKWLNFKYNQISEIEPGTFSGLRLQQLAMTSNKLSKLTPDTMQGIIGTFPGLNFNAAWNNIRSISPYTFSGGGSTYVRISVANNAMLTEIQSRLFYRPGRDLLIGTLDFSRNGIEHVAGDALLGVKYLQDIYLSINNIASLSEDLFDNVTIFGTLDLSSNYLSSLPVGLLRFQQKLRTLYLQQNAFRALRREIFAELHSLTTLMVADNPLTEINDQPFSGTQLVNLYLFNAGLCSIGDRPFATRTNSLLVVSLYGNNIKVFADTVWQDLAPHCNVTIDSTLRKVPFTRPDLNINVVGSDFVQTLCVTQREVDVFSRSGFICDAEASGVYRCSTCRQGTFGGASGDCKPCPAGGFFQNRTGQVVKKGATLNCLFCNNGTYVTPESHPGRTIADCVVCPSGTDKSRRAGFRACPCVPDFYRKDRFGECFACPSEGIDCSGEYQHLLPGFWWTWDWGSVDDYQSYDSYVQNILIHGEGYAPSTVRFRGSLPKVHRCPRDESCPNPGDGINATCDRGYAGFLCSQCIAAYYSWFDQCFECPKWYVFLLEVAAALAFVAVVVVAVLWDLRRHRRRGRSAVNLLFSRLKIVVGFYQIVGEIFEALDGIRWPKALSSVGSFFRLLEVNIIRLIVSPRCYVPDFTYPTIYIQFITGLSFVVAVGLLATAVCGCRKTYLSMTPVSREVRKQALAKTKQTCYLVVVILLFITYPSVSSAIFTLLPPGCDEFHLDESGQFSTLRLRSDYSVDCRSSRHVHFNYAAEVSLAYVVGFPAALLVMLWVSHRGAAGRSSRTGERPLRDIAVQSDRESLSPCRPSDCSETDRPATPQLVMDTSETADARLEEVEPDGVTVTGPALSESDRIREPDDSQVTWVSFLCENYKEQFWYWEIVELARKVLQVVFVLLFGAEDHFTLFAAIVLSVAFLIAHAYLKPMKDATEHRLQMCSLTTIFLNLLAASLLVLPDAVNQSSDARKEFLVVFLILLNLSIIALVAGSAAWTLAKVVWKTSCCSRVLACVVLIGRLTLRAARSRPRRPISASNRSTGHGRTTLLSGRPACT